MKYYFASFSAIKSDVERMGRCFLSDNIFIVSKAEKYLAKEMCCEKVIILFYREISKEEFDNN